MTENDTPTRGRAFRRIGGTALAGGAAVCAIAALFSSLPAQAAVTHHAAATGSAAPHVTAHPHVAVDARTSAEKLRQLRAAVEKRIDDSPEVKDINAYYAAGYGYEDALDLAVLWNAADRNHAKTTAGAQLLAGQQLPFGPGQGFARSYTEDQQLRAFALAEPDDPGLADRLAASWKVSTHDAKVKAGGLALANKPVPLEHPTPSAGDAAAAFFAAGYDYADAGELAQLWKIDTYSAKIKAGQDLLSTPRIPLPIQP
ncbi:hypothetical protein [Curtobacterium aetherium]|uniref:Uncharacterized protein n=1 Tax=Curtobacterium aetherium TaxID=2841594 RepID=A0ACD1E8D8_9MICO|nr:hypothetical protein [Curtobacterium sp. L6-1]QWS34967.1 hypothetical protein KM842_07555 [Curtobacterium sp. L6-1]